MPIVGPTLKYHQPNHAGLNFSYGYNAKGVYPRPVLPYYRNKNTGVGSFWLDNVIRNVQEEIWHNVLPGTYEYAKAYDKWWGKAFETASLGISFYEGRQTIKMARARISQFSQMLRAIRRRDARSFIESMSIGAVEKRKPIPESVKVRVREAIRRPSERLADNFLELSFGWAPVVRDIVACYEVFNQDFKAVPHKARCLMGPVYRSYDDGGSSYNVQAWGLRTIGGRIRIINHNILLANQLGLINLPNIAWDAVPFSFIVDRFTGISKYLASWTNDFGVEVTHTYQQKAVHIRGSYWHVAAGSVNAFPTFRLERFLGMPTPGFWDRFNAPSFNTKDLSIGLALVVQQLSALTKTKR